MPKNKDHKIKKQSGELEPELKDEEIEEIAAIEEGQAPTGDQAGTGIHQLEGFIDKSNRGKKR